MSDGSSDDGAANGAARFAAFVARAKEELAQSGPADLEKVRDRLEDEAERDGLPAGNVHTALAQALKALDRSSPDCAALFELSVVSAAEVRPEKVSWLWDGRIPKGKMALIEGDPGLGKSTLCLDLAARVTSGRPMPGSDDRQAPANVVLISSEDGIADTTVPRLEAHDADLGRVTIVRGVPVDEGPDPLLRPFTIPGDVEMLRRTVLEVGARLVVIDPLMAHMASGVNTYRDQDVRAALAPFSRLADESGATILFVRHLVKSRAGQAIHQGGGSIGIIASVRSALVVVRDPDDGRGRIVASQKSNLARASRSLRFSLEPTGPNGAARIVWGGESDHLAEELLADPERGNDQSAIAEAVEFLRTELAEGPRWSREVQKAHREAGLTDATIRRAKVPAGVVSIRSDGRWMWSLRDQGAQGVLDLTELPDEHLERRCPDLGVSRKSVAQSRQGAHPRGVSTLVAIGGVRGPVRSPQETGFR